MYIHTIKVGCWASSSILLGVLLIGCSSPNGSSSLRNEVVRHASSGAELVRPELPPPAISQARTPSPKVESENLGQTLPISAQATVADRTIELEVARTPREQAMGLMYRNALGDYRGMLFPFESPQLVRFWMKNVRLPLDMIFLRDGEVKAIAASVPPCTASPCPTYGPETAVNQVIELRGGRAAKLGLKVGDRMKIQFLDSKLRQH